MFVSTRIIRGNLQAIEEEEIFFSFIFPRPIEKHSHEGSLSHWLFPIGEKEEKKGFQSNNPADLSISLKNDPHHFLDNYRANKTDVMLKFVHQDRNYSFL